LGAYSFLDLETDGSTIFFLYFETDSPDLETNEPKTDELAPTPNPPKLRLKRPTKSSTPAPTKKTMYPPTAEPTPAHSSGKGKGWRGYL
jgi:hypothetical protein